MHFVDKQRSRQEWLGTVTLPWGGRGCWARDGRLLGVGTWRVSRHWGLEEPSIPQRAHLTAISPDTDPPRLLTPCSVKSNGHESRPDPSHSCLHKPAAPAGPLNASCVVLEVLLSVPCSCSFIPSLPLSPPSCIPVAVVSWLNCSFLIVFPLHWLVL